jgi:hypothetical protein
MRIQRTKEGTFLLVETDSNGETFTIDERDTYVEICDAMEDWLRCDEEWDKCDEDEEIQL